MQKLELILLIYVLLLRTLAINLLSSLSLFQTGRDRAIDAAETNTRGKRFAVMAAQR